MQCLHLRPCALSVLSNQRPLHPQAPSVPAPASPVCAPGNNNKWCALVHTERPVAVSAARPSRPKASNSAGAQRNYQQLCDRPHDLHNGKAPTPTQLKPSIKVAACACLESQHSSLSLLSRPVRTGQHRALMHPVPSFGSQTSLKHDSAAVIPRNHLHISNHGKRQ
jgi:hypothetical protein